MKTERIFSPAHPFFEASFSLYEAAFPPEERRTREDHIRFLAKPDFHCCALTEDGVFLGILFCWETTEFLFLEHFATLPGCGDRGLAQRPFRC